MYVFLVYLPQTLTDLKTTHWSAIVVVPWKEGMCTGSPEHGTGFVQVEHAERRCEAPAEEEPHCWSPINMLRVLIATAVGGLQSLALDLSVSLESGV